jgi:hypothetical protein
MESFCSRDWFGYSHDYARNRDRSEFFLGLVLILASVIVFFVAIAVLEWLFRPR